MRNRMKGLQAAVLTMAATMACGVALAAELPEGTVIEKANLDKVKNDTFQGHTIASLLTEKLEWQIRNWNLKLPLSHAKPVALDPRYLEATRKYAGQVKYDAKTREVSDWVAGIPFPDVSANDPDAGEKLIWNFYYASPEGDIANNKATYLLISGDKGLEQTQDWLFMRYYLKGRLGGENPVSGDGSTLTKTLFVATAPRISGAWGPSPSATTTQSSKTAGRISDRPGVRGASPVARGWIQSGVSTNSTTTSISGTHARLGTGKSSWSAAAGSWLVLMPDWATTRQRRARPMSGPPWT